MQFPTYLQVPANILAFSRLEVFLCSTFSKEHTARILSINSLTLRDILFVYFLLNCKARMNIFILLTGFADKTCLAFRASAPEQCGTTDEQRLGKAFTTQYSFKGSLY